jgi:hypothetical protein
MTRSSVKADNVKVGCYLKSKNHKGKIMETAFERKLKSRAIATGIALTALGFMTALANATTSPSSTTSTVATAPSVLVFDQKAGSGEVGVDYANLQRGGYLVIYPSDSSGQPTKEALGHTPLKAGDHRNVKVKLSTAPQPGSVLWASLYIDTDSQPGFDKGKDASVWPDAIPSSNRFVVK